jgi:formamidopyrimidine-DNA glycosylase
MPELPDLEVICEYLAPRLPGATIETAEVRRPLIVRNLLGGDPAAALAGRRFSRVERRGKFLIFSLDGGVSAGGAAIVINPMLAGRLRYGAPLKRDRTRDVLVLTLDGGRELRYNDTEDMGKIYITRDLAQVPAFAGQGPEATDPGLTEEAFRERLRHYQGEIKGVLTNQAFVAGIGNAYADEILWAARIYPFRRRADLAPDEVRALYAAMRSVLQEAIVNLRARVGDSIDVEVRDFLAIHGKPGQPCPRCGSPVSEVKRERRATNFCRTCQPGLMVGKKRHLE